MIEKSQIKKLLKKRLSDKRYDHSLCVADEAEKLAKKYGADKEKAELAGLLHDIMKEEEPKEQLEAIKKAGIILDKVEIESKKLWHQIAGMAYCKTELNITDEDILNSIRYHTSARKDMSLLEKIIFIADYTSKDRDYDGVSKMRKLADESLEEAMIYGLSFTIVELAKENKLIIKDSIEAYNNALMIQGKG
ncbi:MAG: bis(5'-nucleosyl)-tetraphosphatase (symmetrical) YqeK [Clostridia bacterium]